MMSDHKAPLQPSSALNALLLHKYLEELLALVVELEVVYPHFGHYNIYKILWLNNADVEIFELL